MTDAIDILLVEDNPDDVELTMRALSLIKLDERVHVVNDGAQALDYLLGDDTPVLDGQRTPPRLVLLDVKLPKVSGLEVLQKLKGEDRTRSIPVIMLTSSREERDIHRCYTLGVNSYVVKPVDFDDFTDAVAKISHYWMEINEQPTH